MPLMLPPADERTFASLVADARARLPRLAPDWTDHNAHDPGITLIELLAHLTETDLYRLGRVTAAERRAFLRWFGVESGGPSVAETVLALSFPAASPGLAPIDVPNDRELSSSSGDVTFSTTAPVTVHPSRIAALFVADRRIFTGAPSAATAVLGSPAQALGPRGEDALVIALDAPAPVTGNLRLYLWTGAPDHDADVRRRLREEAVCAQRDRHRADRRCPGSRFDAWPRHHEVDVVWEAGTAKGWVPIERVHDRTRALTMSGFVRLKVDAVLERGAATVAPTAYALRVRAVRGRYEIPPVLQAVLVNAVPARHQSRRFRIPLGTSTGAAGQRLRVTRSAAVPAPEVPLVFDRTAVFVTQTAGSGDKWTVASDWDRAGHGSTVALVDAEGGEICFGDGYRGRVPPAGASIDLESRVGGGPGGNVAAHTLTRVERAAPPLAVDQPFPAEGGGPARAPADLQARMLARLAHPSRAVTLADFERLTLDTPGVRVGRAYAIADHHPDCPGLPARGCVTVVVVPAGSGPAPEPTRGLLTAVTAYLGRRRPVTTELHVVAPTYKKVAVKARLHLFSYADAAAVILAARIRLDALFHPLTGGLDGRGWPVGRDIYRSDVLALLQETPGVHHVEDLFLLVGADREPHCHNVPVCPTDLIAIMPHDVTIDAARIR